MTALTLEEELSRSSFKDIGVLGRGTYGSVKLCQKIGDNKLFAVKEVN